MNPMRFMLVSKCLAAIVETLLERGFVVLAINPKQVERFRFRITAPEPRMTDAILA